MPRYHKSADWGLLVVGLVIVIVVSVLMGIADEHDVNNRPEQPIATTGTDQP